MEGAIGVVGVLAGAAVIIVGWLWPCNDPTEIEHWHDDLAREHPHLANQNATRAIVHSHVYVIDDDYPRWPS